MLSPTLKSITYRGLDETRAALEIMARAGTPRPTNQRVHWQVSWLTALGRPPSQSIS